MRHLDTDITIAYLNGNTNVATMLKASLPDVAISSLVLAELLYGARLSNRAAQNLEQLLKLEQMIDVAEFDRASADAYAHLRVGLRQKGKPTGEIDALIAAVAMANGATLVTHNTKHFENIEGLHLEDWLT